MEKCELFGNVFLGKFPIAHKREGAEREASFWKWFLNRIGSVSLPLLARTVSSLFNGTGNSLQSGNGRLA